MNIWNLKEVIFGVTRNITKEAHDASLLLYTDTVYKNKDILGILRKVEKVLKQYG